MKWYVKRTRTTDAIGGSIQLLISHHVHEQEQIIRGCLIVKYTLLNINFDSPQLKGREGPGGNGLAKRFYVM